MVGVMLVLAGLYVSVEGFLNVFYWRRAAQPLLFQTGRLLRGIIGIGLVAVGLGF